MPENNKLGSWSLEQPPSNNRLSAPSTANIEKVDPRLVDVLRRAAEEFPLRVEVTPSGGSNARKSQSSQHNKNKAIDIQIYDENDKPISNYQDGSSFRTYEQFAQTARKIQQEQYPELGKNLRWGGYFSGKKNYGALDLMHFDLGGSDNLGMAGGSWEKGLSEQQRKYYPTAMSSGMSEMPTEVDTPQRSTKPIQLAFNQSSNTLSDADLESMLIGGSQETKKSSLDIPDWAQLKKSSGASTPAANYSDDDLERMLTGSTAKTTSNSESVEGKSAESPSEKSDKREFLPGEIWNGVRVAMQPAGLDPDPSWWSGFKNSDQTEADKEVGRERNSWGDWAGQAAVGGIRGAKTVLDTAAEGLGAGASFIADKTLPESWANAIRSSHEDTVRMDREAQDSWNREYGDQPVAKLGELAGEIGATAPLLGSRLVTSAGKGIGAMVPGARVAEGVAQSGLSKIAQAGATGALQGAGFNALTSSRRDEPLWQQVAEGALGGAAIGGGLQAAGTLGKGVVNKLVGADKTTKALAEAAERQGIKLRGSQVSNSGFLKKLDQISGQVPLGGGGKAAAKQQGQFNRAVAKTFGEEADVITPEVINRARDRLSQSFDNIAEKTDLVLDKPLVEGFKNLLNEAKDHLVDSQFKVIGAKVDDVIKMAGEGGQLTGKQYQALTRYNTPLSRAMKSADPEIRYYANEIKDLLDDALERSTPREFVKELRQTKAQWKAMKTVEGLAETGTGDVSPLQLMTKVRASPGGKRSSGGLSELADIGKRFLKEPKDSGTPAGNMIMGALTHPGTQVAALASAAASHLPYAIEGGLAFGGNKLMRMGILDRDYFRNAVLGTSAPARTGAANRLIKTTLPIMGATANTGS